MNQGKQGQKSEDYSENMPQDLPTESGMNEDEQYNMDINMNEGMEEQDDQTEGRGSNLTQEDKEKGGHKGHKQQG
jgi:hypothetical protein